MKKIILSMGLLAITTITYAQVGINNYEPKATLDVKTKTEDWDTPTKIKSEGILIPNLTAEQVKKMTESGVISTDQDGLTVYVTEAFADPDTNQKGKYELIDSKGYYYYNSTEDKWKKLLDTKNIYTAGAGMKLNDNEFSRDGLEKVTENGNTGWRLIGRDPQYYLPIGIGAVDFSYNDGGPSKPKSGATGNFSTAIGYKTTASELTSVAIGYETTASGTVSTAMGWATTASGNNSTATGWQTTASGTSSTAMGYRTTASGDNSTAMGEGTTASGKNSTAMGWGTKASRVHSTAIRVRSVASGAVSIAMGDEARASGGGSIAIGTYTNAASQRSIAMGSFNTIEKNPGNDFDDKTKRLLVLGNGNAGGARSDALTVLRNATVGIDIDNFEETYIEDAKLQVNGLIQSRGILEADASSFSKIVVVDGAGTFRATELSTVRGEGYTDGDGITISDDNKIHSLWKRNNKKIELTKLSDGNNRTDDNKVTIDDKGVIAVTGVERRIEGAKIYFPDYVFEKYYKGYSELKADYNFKSLNQVESFIRQNGHLPGYKSAKEISKEGIINMGDVQLTNVEKIEELYLHLIEKEKEVQELKSEMKAQKEEIRELKTLVQKLIENK